MRVLFLQRQPCVRALKYAVGFRDADFDVQLGFAYQGRTLTEFYGSGDELFEAWWDLGSAPRPADELRAAIDGFQPDLIHSHNLPDILTVLALELVGDRIPVVHDIHDLQSLRATPYLDGFDEPVDPLGLERAAIEGAAAVITVSPELVDVLRRLYGPSTQAMMVGNLALRRDRITELPPKAGSSKVPTIVYEGSLSADGGHYDLRDIFRSLARGGLPVVIHPARSHPDYAALADEVPAISYSEPLGPSALMEALPQYDLGWVGFNSTLNAAHLDTVLPNKLYEYLGAGLPVVTLRSHLALRRFVEQEGVGLVVESADDVAEAVQDLDMARLRRVVAENRDRFTFEANLGQVIALYRDLVGTAERLPVTAAG
jgi:Glycosyl transferase 4-like domain